jgi:hypothetical protein
VVANWLSVTVHKGYPVPNLRFLLSRCAPFSTLGRHPGLSLHSFESKHRITAWKKYSLSFLFFSFPKS